MHIDDPKLYVEALGFFQGAEELNMKEKCVGRVRIVCINHDKLDLSLGSEDDTIRLDKVNYSIPHPNTMSTWTFIHEKSNTHDENVAIHTINAKELEYPEY